MSIKPLLGCAFRLQAYKYIVNQIQHFEVFEIMAEHYLSSGREKKKMFKEIIDKRPIVLHGIGLSIGTALKPDISYLKSINRAIKETGAIAYTEHLAFTKIPNLDTAHLLPLPRTEDSIEIVKNNMELVKEYIDVPIFLENIAYYYDYESSYISEVDFINMISRACKVGVLLDIENLYINSKNHNYDPFKFILNLDKGVVKGMHLAGGDKYQGLLIDTHNRRLDSNLYPLMSYALKMQNPDWIIIERDDRFEHFQEVVEDCFNIKNIISERTES